jgi:hypothetical protein
VSTGDGEERGHLADALHDAGVSGGDRRARSSERPASGAGSHGQGGASASSEWPSERCAKACARAAWLFLAPHGPHSTPPRSSRSLRSPHSPDQHAAVDRVAEEQAHGAALDQRVAGAEEEARADDAAEGEELV